MTAYSHRLRSIKAFPLTGRAVRRASSSRAVDLRAPVSFLFAAALGIASVLAAPVANGAEAAWTTAWGVAPMLDKVCTMRESTCHEAGSARPGT